MWIGHSEDGLFLSPQLGQLKDSMEQDYKSSGKVFACFLIASDYGKIHKKLSLPL
jgi:hypothetical protein